MYSESFGFSIHHWLILGQICQAPALGAGVALEALKDLQVWRSAVTNGIFIRFGDVELSHDELFSMVEQEH